MAVYVLRAESLALETCVLSLTVSYALLLQLAVAFHASHLLGLLLLLASCSYGICASDVQHGFSRRFSRCAAALGVLSCVAAFAHTGFICEQYHSLHDEEHVDPMVPRAIPIVIGFVLALLLKVVEVGLAAILVVKHARLSMQQGPRTCTTTVPTHLEMQENRCPYYPPVVSSYSNPLGTQPVAGQPTYL